MSQDNKINGGQDTVYSLQGSGKDNMIIKRSDFKASLCKLVLTDASGNFIEEMIVNKVTNIL